MDILSNITELSDERLAEYATEVRAAFDALAALDSATEAQLAEAEAYADHLDAIAAAQTSRVEAATALSARHEALRTRFAKDEEAEPVDDEAKKEPEPEPEPETAAVAPVAPVVVPAAVSTVATLASKTERPVQPAASAKSLVTITAAADVPHFSTGSVIEDMGTVGTALVNRMRGFGTPSGDGATESLQHFGVASFKLDFPAELTIDRHSDDMEVLTRASNEYRLPGDSLVAAGGWCAPSEVLYDLCSTETNEGILSVPEVNVARGGIKYTSGPDFSTIYAAVGFCQTETQAIAGTTKTCFEVPCPSFVEVRLDACGLCIKAPILTNAAYPELVQRWLTGAMIAHQHQMNAKVIASMVTAAGAARVPVGLGAVATDTFDYLVLYADQLRQKYRMSFSATMEVVLPFYVEDIIRGDMSRRNGIDVDSPVTDAIIAAEFAARKMHVSYVYDWQDLNVALNVWPATFQALMYPAGTFVKGTSDIITLNAVYDAASLATNIYTALFFEQGILVAKMCNEATLITIPNCNAGRTGIAALDCV